MSGSSTGSHDQPAGYEIRVRGHLGSGWAAWFDGLRLTGENDGTTVIRGPLADQAALHGVLQKVRDMGLPLLSVTEVDADEPEAPTTGPR
ncbi:hypothetical protein [Georgenia sp. AZ-5]|uniref:hypothetical protein n=1 Tax=Georgenia sp. AZ-5 TaxID=3367526 RepID=UPI003754AA77